MVGICNELLEEIAEADTIITFERHLDRYTHRIGLDHGSSTGRWD